MPPPVLPGVHISEICPLRKAQILRPAFGWYRATFVVRPVPRSGRPPVPRVAPDARLGATPAFPCRSVAVVRAGSSVLAARALPEPAVAGSGNARSADADDAGPHHDRSGAARRQLAAEGRCPMRTGQMWMVDTFAKSVGKQSRIRLNEQAVRPLHRATQPHFLICSRLCSTVVSAGSSQTTSGSRRRTYAAHRAVTGVNEYRASVWTGECDGACCSAPIRC